MTHQGIAVNRIAGTEFSPQRGVRAVGQNADNGIGHRVPQARPQENGRRDTGGKPKYVRIKICLKKNHRHEDEIGGGIRAAITNGLFDKR